MARRKVMFTFTPAQLAWLEKEGAARGMHLQELVRRLVDAAMDADRGIQPFRFVRGPVEGAGTPGGAHDSEGMESLSPLVEESCLSSTATPKRSKGIRKATAKGSRVAHGRAA